MDPKDILFSLPTFCDPVPPTASDKPGGDHKSLHEDDWRQIEFVSPANRSYIQSKLVELEAFKKQHRRGQGFTDVFVRSEHPTPFQSVGYTAAQLPKLTESALTLGGATVFGGFALSDASGWFIYGQRSPDGRIIQLAVSPDNVPPSERIIRALSDIAGTRLMLVDWYASTIVDTGSLESISAWARRHQ